MQIICGSYLKWCINIILKHHLKLLVYKHIPQDKPEQADQIFLLSIILEILLTWEYKQPYHIAKKNSSFNGKYDVFIKPFCFVTSIFSTLVWLNVSFQHWLQLPCRRGILSVNAHSLLCCCSEEGLHTTHVPRGIPLELGIPGTRNSALLVILAATG